MFFPLGILGLLCASAMAFSIVCRRKDYTRRLTGRKAHRQGAEKAEDSEEKKQGFGFTGPLDATR